MDAKTWEFQALTDVWTGDVDGRPGRLITTGILGSVRWWFEVVVRGLGGFACDPSAKHKTCQDDQHCVVCELFGCTGWARKFRFDVLDDNNRPKRDQIKKGDKFRLRFTPLRPIRDEEWELLDLTLRLIAGYGAIGGKTVYKPTEQENRKRKDYHRDFGLIRMQRPADGIGGRSRAELESYVQGNRWRKSKHGGFGWASLEHFWCVQQDWTLARRSNQKSTFNQVLGRQQPKRKAGRLADQNDAIAHWLAGGIGRSKKVFSFQDPARTFGFVHPMKGTMRIANKNVTFSIDYEEMKQRLQRVWPDFAEQDYQKGTEILDALLHPGKGS